MIWYLLKSTFSSPIHELGWVGSEKQILNRIVLVPDWNLPKIEEVKNG